MTTYGDMVRELQEKNATIAGLQRERDEALARETEWLMRYKSTMIVQQRGYDRAIEEAAELAKNFGLPAAAGLDMALAYRQQNIAAAILALKDKP